MLRLDHQRRVSPLSNWPDAYAAATVTAILALDVAEKERAVEMQQESNARARAGR